MRILITGAAGNIGSVLHRGLRNPGWELRLADINKPNQEIQENEEFVSLDITKLEAVKEAMKGVDCVIHLAGIPTEAAWDKILSVNINGTHNVFEAARLAGVKQVIFASSNHAVGFYKSDEVIDEKAAPKPDTYYGVSKVAGEALASLYAKKCGLSTVCIRIGSFEKVPSEKRHLTTWVSPEDFTNLVKDCINKPRPGECLTLYIWRF